MNNINRVLVKSQAKKIISEKVFALFIISAIALILTNGLNIYNSVSESYDTIQNGDYYYNDENSLNDYNDYYDYFNQFSDDDYEGSDNPIENFGNPSQQSYSSSNALDKSNLANINIGNDSAFSIGGTLSVIFSPLVVTLCGFYVALIKKNPEEELKLSTEIGNLFKNSFNGSFLKKLVIYILRSIFVVLLCILLIVPGIIYYYSTYFAFQLLNDYPNLKPTEAFKLSRKIIRGNRSELFWLDISFIPWFLLCCITCGIASIYVIPYFFTTQALYYENFRLRAIAEGRVSEDDFLSAEELSQKYNQGANNGSYYNPNSSNQYTQNNSGNQYYNNAQQNYYNQASQPKEGYYYNPYNSKPAEEQPQSDSGYSYAQPQGDGDGGEYSEKSSDSGQYCSPIQESAQTEDNSENNSNL